VSLPVTTITDVSFEDSFFYSSDVYIHPTAHVGPKVQLGVGTKIGPYTIITGNVTIGDHSRAHSHVIIGTPAQADTVKTPLGKIIIGKNTIIKEFATISAPRKAGGTTQIGDNCFCMHFSHIAHDAIIENHATLANHAQIAGHAHIAKHALLMAHAVVHQFCRIGAYAALAPFSGCRQDIPPYGLYAHQPALFAGLNRVKLKRAAFSEDSQRALKKLTDLFYRLKLPFQTIKETCIKEPWGNDIHVQNFLTFVESSDRGISRQTLTQTRGT